MKESAFENRPGVGLTHVPVGYWVQPLSRVKSLDGPRVRVISPVGKEKGMLQCQTMNAFCHYYGTRYHDRRRQYCRWRGAPRNALLIVWRIKGLGFEKRVNPTDMYEVPDAVPPIHAVSSHVASDKDPSKFRSIFSDNLQPIASHEKKARGTLLVDIGCSSERAPPPSVSYYNEISSGHIWRGCC